MNDRNASYRATLRALPIAYATAVAVASAVSLSLSAHANPITVPPVPTDLAVPAGNHAFLLGHGKGTQNYVCLPSGSGFAWTLFTPEATLFKDDGDKQITTHFFSPNPDELNTDARVVSEHTIRATWQHSMDGSSVWAKVAPKGSVVVDSSAIAWLKLEVVGTRPGADGGDALTSTTFIQRLNTVGGREPSSGCAQLADVGSKAFIDYEADYFFYTDR